MWKRDRGRRVDNEVVMCGRYANYPHFRPGNQHSETWESTHVASCYQIIMLWTDWKAINSSQPGHERDSFTLLSVMCYRMPFYSLFNLLGSFPIVIVPLHYFPKSQYPLSQFFFFKKFNIINTFTAQLSHQLRHQIKLTQVFYAVQFLSF